MPKTEEPQSSDRSTRDAVAESTRYLAAKRDELQRQVSEIESFLGFAVQAEDLAVRVAKLEAFVGLKG